MTQLIQILNDEYASSFMHGHDQMRENAKSNLKQISKAQYDKKKKRKKSNTFKENDVAIIRTQFVRKLRPNFYGLYRLSIKPNGRYEVEKVGQLDGPHVTSIAVDFMNKWSTK
ncbi:hypothetical protein CEXT_426951 [Caerostris extrusa]|uniref:Uncharacterized protein n=1 Tax=Caerostris extrusa TaxID=172846 RepID=A0AAV4QIB1_CAEEX|nr:hypothetical protein CEXT_426951 [Caerostris extrusa]